MATIARPLNCALEFLPHRDALLWQRKASFLSLPIPERVTNAKSKMSMVLADN